MNTNEIITYVLLFDKQKIKYTFGFQQISQNKFRIVKPFKINLKIFNINWKPPLIKEVPTKIKFYYA